MQTSAALSLQKKQMRIIIYILFSLFFSAKLCGENFRIDKYRCSNKLYTHIINHIFRSHNNNKEISLSNEGNIIYVSYANKKNISFHKSVEKDDVFLKKKGKYIANLFIKKNQYDTIVEAYFIVIRKNKQIAKISLTRI
ncbi:hypothetical protein C801_01449 [Bacteroides uniformis dnLKV2]|uniref:Uncharacterized protein n=1 Tax=Bacteroides uniformis dnLKV2 TaxID=1235787 RepID=R9HW80_BACUN|nr:hypothetical protein C801_01449 [Bacteroides uniformis dnLKV2]